MKEIKMPQLGQSVEEASIVQWLKKEGDSIAVGEPIFTIQTDKAEIEYESAEEGTLRKILVQEDEEVPVFTVVALVGDAGEAIPDLAQYATGSGSAAPAEAESPKVEEAKTEVAPEPEVEVASSGSTAKVSTTSGFASPRARKTADSHDVDLTQLDGSGPHGRVLEADVLAYEAGQEAVASSPSARRMAKMGGIDLTTVEGTGPSGRVVKEDIASALEGGTVPATSASVPKQAIQPIAPSGDGKVTPLSPMRKVIAQRMIESKFGAPHFYITIEVDMKKSMAYRTGLGDFKPSFNELVLRACARAIQDYPVVNSRWLGDAIEELQDINIGFAVTLPTGLIVPVIKQMQKKSLQDISRESKVLAEKARTGKLTPEDYTGNTFTVSNLGVFGVDHFTAIINQPDSAILAVGQIKDRPVVIDGGIHVRPIMKVTLSSDHRVIDGAVAAQFLGRLKEILENADY